MRYRIALFSILGLIAASVTATASDVTYAVDATDGTETLTGFITTNNSGYIGGVGELSEVFQWSFQASGPIQFSILWVGPNNATIQGFPTLFATNTSIDVVNNNSPAAIYGTTGGWAVSFQGVSNGVANIALDYDHGTDDFVTEYNLYVSNPIAAVPSPVPLPAAGWLMLCGLGCLGALVRRTRTAAIYSLATLNFCATTWPYRAQETRRRRGRDFPKTQRQSGTMLSR